MSQSADLLGLLFAPEVVAALEQRMAEIAVEAVREELARQQGRNWLPIAEAAAEYGCSAQALTRRVQRGQVPCRRQGRRLYVPAVPPDNGAEIP